MTYVFDIDGTVCTNTKGEYEKASPFLDRIQLINKLYDDGHKIIMFTARGMARHNGNVNKAFQQFYHLTSDQLKGWGLKFHELKLGKPAADIFIDDKGTNDEDFFRTNIRP